MSENDSILRSNRQYRPYWETACEDYHQPLSSYAARLTNGKAYDAEDLVQETKCCALLSFGDPDVIRNPLSYLLRTMHNLWVDKWKRENTANMQSLDGVRGNAGQNDRAKAVEPFVESDILRILENNELQESMGVKQGPLNHREELLLSLHLKGYKCKDIAAELREDVRLIRSDLNAVRAKVRYRLTKRKAKAKTTT